MSDPNWAAIAALGLTMLGLLVGAVLWFARLEGKANTAKDMAAAASAAAKEAAHAVEASAKEAIAAISARVGLCEQGHASTAGELNSIRVDVAILRERSDAQVATLARIENALAPPTARRTRKVAGQ
jgi:hypothetical protein